MDIRVVVEDAIWQDVELSAATATFSIPCLDIFEAQVVYVGDLEFILGQINPIFIFDFVADGTLSALGIALELVSTKHGLRITIRNDSTRDCH